ncbi:MAG: PAS domain S-box protein [Spirochaetes bacterium]|nr:PAS domain S-box protein [Spirochaetota bacterium]
MRIKSIRNFIFILFLVIVIVVNSIVFIYYYAVSFKRVETDAKKYILSISKPVVFNLASLLSINDRIKIEIILANLKSVRFVRDVMLFDNTGQMLIGNNKDFRRQKYTAVNSIIRDKRLVAYSSYGAFLGCALPVYGVEFYNRTKTDLKAVLYVEVSLNEFTSDSHKVLLSFFALNLGSSIFLSILFILILTKFIFEPLIKITGVTNQVARGSYIEIDETGGKYEFKNLFASFNRMSRNLNLYTTKLEILNNDLTAEVNKRTGELEELKDRFKDIAGAVGDLLWEIDGSGCYTYCSEGILSVLGYKPEEVLGQHITFSFTGPQSKENLEYFNNSLQSCSPFSFECLNCSTGGLSRVIRITGKPFYDREGNFRGYRGVSKDITGEVELEKNIQRMHRIESLGLLIGGIAHDFNNILNIVKNFADLLRKTYSEEDREKYIAEITKAVFKGSSLIKRLLILTKKRHGKKEKLLPVNQLNDLCKFFTRLFGNKITIDNHIEIDNSEGIFIFMDPTEFDQIFMNLAINSRDAMPEGGTITLTGDIFNSFQIKDVLPVSPKADEYLKVSFSDTGTGMEPDVTEKIFEPFFTTKKIHNGTGLGLAIVFAIVNHSGGAVKVNSKPGSGTTFDVYLPVLTD